MYAFTPVNHYGIHKAVKYSSLPKHNILHFPLLSTIGVFWYPLHEVMVHLANKTHFTIMTMFGWVAVGFVAGLLNNNFHEFHTIVFF